VSTQAQKKNPLAEFDWSTAKVVDGGGALRRGGGDTLLSGLRGVVGAGEALVGLANIPTFGRAGRAMESIGYDPKATKDFIGDFYSPAQKLANYRAQQAEGFVGTGKAMLENPSTIAHGVIESLPSTLGGGALGQVARRAAPSLSARLAAGIGEGAVIAGGTAEGIRQQTDDGLLTGKQALASLGAGVLGGATAFAGGTLGKKLGLADIDTALVQGGLGAAKHGVLRRTAGGALTEGLLEELPQSMQEQAWENYALDRPLMDNVGKAGAQGLLTGVAMGGGANVLARRAPQNPQDATEEAAQGQREPLGLPAPEQGLPPYDPFTDLSPIPPAPPAGPLTRAANILTENLPQVAPLPAASCAVAGSRRIGLRAGLNGRGAARARHSGAKPPVTGAARRDYRG